MRRRSWFWTIVLVLLVFFAVLALVDLTSLSGTPATATAAPEPTASPSTTPTVIPTGVSTPSSPVLVTTNRFKDNVDLLDKWLTPVGAAFLRLLVLLLAVPLIVQLINVSLQLIFRPRELVFEDITNSTGNADLDSVIKGLSTLARQWIIRDFRRSKQIIKDHSTRFVGTSLHTDWVADQVSNAFDQRVTTLMQSVNEFAPENLKPIVGLVRILFPQRGVRITTALVSLRTTPLKPVVSFEMVDVEQRYQPVIEQISEEKAPVSPPPNDSAASMNLPEGKNFLEIGQSLLMAGLFDDAVEFLEPALKNTPGDSNASKSIGECIKRKQIRAAGSAAYTLGKQLEDAGLLDQAIHSYAEALPLEKQTEAAAEWKKVLNSTQEESNKAGSYFWLAEAYRKIYLDEDAIELYKRAARAGHLQSQTELESWNKEVTTLLCQASDLLLQAGRFVSAKKYVDLAIAKTPDDPKALSIATLLSKNAESTADFTSDNYQLATVYTKFGYGEEATKYAEQALTEQPVNALIQDLLQRSLDLQNGIVERYERLLSYAVRCMVIEMTGRELLYAIPQPVRFRDFLRRVLMKLSLSEKVFHSTWFNRQFPSSNEYVAKVHQFIGIMYDASMRGQRNRFFFAKAKEHFLIAIDLMENPGRPYYQLAQSLSFANRYGLLKEKPNDASLFEETIRYYQLSIDLFGDQQDALRRSRLGIAAQRFRMNESKEFTKAKELIEEIVKDGREQVAFQMEASFLYNLACWYGLAYQRETTLGAGKNEQAAKDYYSQARYFLPCFLLHDELREFWDQAEADKDLKAVIKDFSDLTYAIRKNYREYRDINEIKTPEEFKQKVDKLISDANWKLDLVEKTGG